LETKEEKEREQGGEWRGAERDLERKFALYRKNFAHLVLTLQNNSNADIRVGISAASDNQSIRAEESELNKVKSRQKRPKIPADGARKIIPEKDYSEGARVESDPKDCREGSGTCGNDCAQATDKIVSGKTENIKSVIRKASTTSIVFEVPRITFGAALDLQVARWAQLYCSPGGHAQLRMEKDDFQKCVDRFLRQNYLEWYTDDPTAYRRHGTLSLETGIKKRYRTSIVARDPLMLRSLLRPIVWLTVKLESAGNVGVCPGDGSSPGVRSPQGMKVRRGPTGIHKDALPSCKVGHFVVLSIAAESELPPCGNQWHYTLSLVPDDSGSETEPLMGTATTSTPDKPASTINDDAYLHVGCMRSRHEASVQHFSHKQKINFLRPGVFTFRARCCQVMEGRDPDHENGDAKPLPDADPTASKNSEGAGGDHRSHVPLLLAEEIMRLRVVP